MWLELSLLAVILSTLFYRWATKNNDFYAKRGVAYDKPVFLLGSMKDMMFRKKSFFDSVVTLYRKSENKKVYGIFEQRTPLLIIRDPKIVKHITVKDFDHFVNHRSIIDDSDDGSYDLFGNSLFLMKDSKWKDMRSTLSPVFTGSKMRHMFELINQVAENTSNHLVSLQKTKGASVELEMKDFSTRFTTDIIASTAFGLQVNSFKDKSNEFFSIGKKITSFKGLQLFKFIFYNTLKPLMKLLKIELFGKETREYFMHLVLDAMQYRKKHNIFRPDMIHSLMEARGMIESEHPKSHNREWSDTEIVAQCFLFFFAGFDTSSILMCFTAHELMENPDVQQRLYEEIEEVEESLNGKGLTYEALQGMKYMDMVLSEALRKWPPAIATDRCCTKDFLYVDEDDGERIEIKKGDGVWIPIVGLQRDEKYFPNPDQFDPERFSNENKDNITPFTYMPFGMGPRNCIGLRFALLEAKALIYYIVRDFRIEVGEKTSLPLELAKKSFQITAKNGFWMKFTSRKSN